MPVEVKMRLGMFAFLLIIAVAAGCEDRQRVALPESLSEEKLKGVLNAAQLPEEIRTEILAAFKRHPLERKWVGIQDKQAYAVVWHTLLTTEMGPKINPELVTATEEKAAAEVLKIVAVKEHYTDPELSDQLALLRAVQQASGELEVIGKTKQVRRVSAVRDNQVIACAHAYTDQINAALTTRPELEKVRAAYQTVLHVESRSMLANGHAAEALILLQHLHQRKLESTDVFLDVVRCFIELKQTDSASRLLAEVAKRPDATSGLERQKEVIALTKRIDTVEVRELGQSLQVQVSKAEQADSVTELPKTLGVDTDQTKKPTVPPAPRKRDTEQEIVPENK